MQVRSASDVVRDVEDRIERGLLQPGDRLPPVRTVARELGLAPNTVASAYRRLRERGVVAGRGRQGTVVVDRPLVLPIADPGVPSGMVDAATGNPDTSLLPDLAAAVAVAAAAPAVRYGDPTVVPQLLDAAGRVFASDAVDAEHLTVTSGAMDAVERLLGVHTRPGDRVGVEDPGYAAVHQVVTGLGLEPVPIPVDDRGLLVDGLDRALGDGLDALIVTPRAHNPAGCALDGGRAEALDELLVRHDEVVVIQDDHAGPVAGTPFVGLSTRRRRWAVVRSVAKSLGPDLRVAMVAGDRETVQRLEARVQLGPGWVSHLLQRTVAELLNDAHAVGLVRRAAETYSARRRRLADLLAASGVGCWARSGLNVWIPVTDESDVVAAMRDRGVAIRAGDRFRIQSPPAVRVTVAGLDDTTIDRVGTHLLEVLEPSGAGRIA